MEISGTGYTNTIQFKPPVTPKQPQKVNNQEVPQENKNQNLPEDEVILGKQPKSQIDEQQTKLKNMKTTQKSHTAQATAIFASSAGYALADSVQVPNRKKTDSDKMSEEQKFNQEEGLTERDLKGELKAKKEDFKNEVKKETFDQIDDDQSIEGSLERFKKLKKDMEGKPITKSEEEQSRLAIRRLKEAHKEIRRGELSVSKETQQDIRLMKSHFQEVRNSYNMDKREKQLERVEEQVPGGSLNYVEESFFLNSKTPAKEMTEVAGITRELEKDKSSYKIEGNRVEPLEGKEIWEKKMDLLDEALDTQKKNKEVNVGNVEVDAEYYELGSPQMIGKLKDIADNGGKVRVLMDGGRLAYKSKGEMDATQIAYRLDTMSDLQENSDKKDMALVLFPTKEELGATGNLMHRKILRVGDKVVMGGMNANPSSAENVDYAKEIEGPAAKRLTEIYKRDVSNSSGKSLEEIYGKNQLDILKNGETIDEKTGEKKNYKVSLSSSGLTSLLKSSIPDEKRGDVFDKSLSEDERLDKIINVLGEKGIDVTKLAKINDINGDGQVTGVDVKDYINSKDQKGVELTENGRKLLYDNLEERVNRTRSNENKEKLGDITMPDASVKGKDTIAIGDLPAERQAILLHTINSAEKFIHVPAFVVTKDVAEALVAKKKEMDAQGKKDFDIKVALDPGIYPSGGTPNEAAYKILENNGIPVRWALLDRSGDHDRKVHSKMMVTDKAILSGSTNFSGKGMRDNWEMSDVTFIDEKNPESLAKRDQFDKDFQRLWDKESISINTKDLAEKKFAGDNGPDAAIKKDEYRDFLMRSSIRNIENYERSVGEKFSVLAKDPKVMEKINELTASGMDKGSATLEALRELYPSEKLDAIRQNSGAWRSLAAMSGIDN